MKYVLVTGAYGGMGKAVTPMLVENGFSILTIIMGFDFGVIGVLCFFAARELQKTKKIEVLSTIFSAIMALSTLLVAMVSAYFAYKAL